MSTIDEQAITNLPGNCRRCGGWGHWADSPSCPWLLKAATGKDHLARIDSLKERWWNFEITEWQKRQFIRDENELQHPAPARRKP